MKKFLLLLSFSLFIALIFGFKNSNSANAKLADMLCEKQWITNGIDDTTAKVIISFKKNNTYEHKYISNKTLVFYGTWSFGDDGKIYVKFNNPYSKIPSTDVYDIIQIDDNTLEIKTKSSSIIKKLILSN